MRAVCSTTTWAGLIAGAALSLAVIALALLSTRVAQDGARSPRLLQIWSI